MQELHLTYSHRSRNPRSADPSNLRDYSGGVSLRAFSSLILFSKHPLMATDRDGIVGYIYVRSDPVQLFWYYVYQH